MKALVYQGPERITYETVDDPTPADTESVIVKVDRCAICGSDLHIYHGHGFSPDTGFCVGHEAIGEIVEVGSGVKRFRSGDRVIIAGGVGCTECEHCRAGRVDLCERGPGRVFGVSAGLPGGQAEAVAVPAADTTLTNIPEGVNDEQALLLTDNLPTGYYGAERAEIVPGQSVAVIGLGPVGMLAAESALLMGASRVFAIDRVRERLDAAETLGATAVRSDTPVDEIREATKGRGVDAAIEAVGADETICMGLHLVRTGGVVSVVGVNQSMDCRFPMGLAFAKSIALHIGLCPVQSFWPKLIPLIQNGRLKPDRVITHRVGLSEGEQAYRQFAAREDGVMKTVLEPGR